MDCEDAAQEAIVVAFAKLHTLKKDAYAKTWLVRILINECYRLLRKQKKAPLSGADTIEAMAYEQNNYSDLYMAITALDLNYRIVISLYYIEGFAADEIARMLGIPPGTVKSRLSRGRARLKQQLTENEDMKYENIILRRSFRVYPTASTVGLSVKCAAKSNSEHTQCTANIR